MLYAVYVFIAAEHYLRDAPESVLKRFTSWPDLSAQAVVLVAWLLRRLYVQPVAVVRTKWYLNIVERACEDR